MLVISHHFGYVVPRIDIVVCRSVIICNLIHILLPDVSCDDLELFFNDFEEILLNENVVIVGHFNIPQFVNNKSRCPMCFTVPNFYEAN